jgi:hypothetical protein
MAWHKYKEDLHIPQNLPQRQNRPSKGIYSLSSRLWRSRFCETGLWKLCYANLTYPQTLQRAIAQSRGQARNYCPLIAGTKRKYTRHPKVSKASSTLWQGTILKTSHLTLRSRTSMHRREL